MQKIKELFRSHRTEKGFPAYFMNKIIQFLFVIALSITYTVVARLLLPMPFFKVGLVISLCILTQIIRYGYITYTGKWILVRDARIDQHGINDSGVLQTILRTEDKLFHGKHLQTPVLFTDLETGTSYATYLTGSPADYPIGTEYEILMPDHYTAVNGIRHIDNIFYIQRLAPTQEDVYPAGDDAEDDITDIDT